MPAFRDDAWPSKQRTGQPSELHVYTVHWVNKCMHSTARALGLNAVTPLSKHKATQSIQPMLF